MNRRLLASIVCATAVTGCGLEMAIPAELPLPVVRLATRAELIAKEVVPASYIVAFRGESLGHRLLNLPSYREEWSFHNGYLSDSYTYDPRVKTMRYIHALDGARRHQPPSEDLTAFLMTPWKQDIVDENAPADPLVLAEVNFASPEDAAEALADWVERGDIWFADPNYLSRLSQDEDSPATGSGVFTQYKTEYSVATPWWFTSIKLLEAFDAANAYTNEPQTPVIAVLDSGLDTTHPAFDGRIFENTSPGVAGCRDDKLGCNTTEPKKGELGDGNVQPFGWTGTECNKVDIRNCQHGTHVAGIVSAKYSGGSYGGVCPVCKVMPIRIISGTPGKGAAKDSAIINGLVYLSRFTTKSTQSALVRVANSSFGKYSRSRAVSLMVSILAKNNGLLVVGAASNEDSMLRAYPAALNDAIAVGAVDFKDRKASYSNFGAWVDVSAPGGDDTESGVPDQLFSSTVPGGGFAGKKGTSMAAPVVAGVAGLILSVDPGRSLKALKSSLIDTADPRIYANSGDTVFNQSYYVNIGVEVRRPLLGSGVVDAAAAINNGEKTGVRVSGISRVNSGCAVVGSQSGSGMLWIVLLPVLLLLFHRPLRGGDA